MKLSKMYYRKKGLFKNCLPIILTITIISSGSYAQRMDSLRRELQLAREGQICAVLYSLGYELVDVNFLDALKYSENSIQCAIQHRDTLQLVKGIQLKAMAFRRLGEVDSSNRIITSILPIVRQKHYYTELQDLLHGLALGLLYKAQFDEALKYNFEALEIRRKHASAFQIGSTLFNIGFVYYKLGDYTRALEYYAQSLVKLQLDPRDGRLIEKLLVNIALAHAYSGNLIQAERYISKALVRCDSNCLPEELENISFCAGVVSLSQGDSIRAKEQFLSSYERAKLNRHERLQLDNIVYLSRISLGLGQLKQAENYLELAERLIYDGVPYDMELMKVYVEFANLYNQQGNFKKVADFQRRHMALKDSIYDDEVTTRLMRIVAGHVEQEKNANIAAQNERLEFNAKIISRQRIATILAVTAAILLAGFIILLVRSIREKKQRNADLEVRVKNRTKELEALVNQSQALYTEKKMWFEKILSVVRHTSNTVNGLSLLASKDIESNERCIKLIEQEMAHLLSHVNSYVSRSNAGIRENNDES